ncbi:MAG: hypothetical protein H3C31_12230 [Brumimicrobium sp.]|nr:hypothetical protein [Brumimicrobium sp.]MCO5268767.1 hypothetical protein [Brumimicrobium sp.]
MKILKNLSFIGLGLLIVASCTNETNNNDVKITIDTDTSNVLSSEEFDFKFPHPYALVASFEEAGIAFDATRINSLENAKNYNTEGKELLNFGVYSSDLVYSIVNNQPQYSLKTFNTIRQLADKVGMGKIFEKEDLAKEVEANIGDRNKMEDLLLDIHERLQEYLQDNGIRVYASVQFAGAWVEGMYLASYEFEKKDFKILSVKVADQMNLLKDAMKGLEAYQKENTDLADFIGKMSELQATYNGFESVQNAQGLPILSENEVAKIFESINAIRAIAIQ